MTANPTVEIELVREFAFLGDYAAGWQFGEQGMLIELARRCGCEQGVEIGAGDGQELPVTLEWFDDLILFEIDEQKRHKLAAKYLDAVIYGAYTHDHACLIDDGSCVVIDVDSQDLAIAQSLLKVSRPAILCVEHYDRHGAYMTDKSHEEPSEPVPSWMIGLEMKDGHSIQQPWRVVYSTLQQHGYCLVALTRVNGIYIHNAYKELAIGWTNSENE